MVLICFGCNAIFRVYSLQLFENFINSKTIEEEQLSITGRSKPFIAAFGQSNEGDVSPNTAGTTCPDGSACNDIDSECEGKKGFCSAKGPGATDLESADIIGRMQFEKAKEIWGQTTSELKVPRHSTSLYPLHLSNFISRTSSL